MSANKVLFFTMTTMTVLSVVSTLVWVATSQKSSPDTPATPSPVQDVFPSPDLPVSNVDPDCKLQGCNSEICSDSNAPDQFSTCIAKPEYGCLKFALCQKQAGGLCGWTYQPEYQSCLKNVSQPDSQDGLFCGGIAGIACPDGFVCKYEGDYPDAGGSCVKSR